MYQSRLYHAPKLFTGLADLPGYKPPQQPQQQQQQPHTPTPSSSVSRSPWSRGEPQPPVRRGLSTLPLGTARGEEKGGRGGGGLCVGGSGDGAQLSSWKALMGSTFDDSSSSTTTAAGGGVVAESSQVDHGGYDTSKPPPPLPPPTGVVRPRFTKKDTSDISQPTQAPPRSSSHPLNERGSSSSYSSNIRGSAYTKGAHTVSTCSGGVGGGDSRYVHRDQPQPHRGGGGDPPRRPHMKQNDSSSSQLGGGGGRQPTLWPADSSTKAAPQEHVGGDDLSSPTPTPTSSPLVVKEVSAEDVRKSNIEMVRGRLRRTWYNTHLTAPAAPSLHTLQRRLALLLLFRKAPMPLYYPSGDPSSSPSLGSSPSSTSTPTIPPVSLMSAGLSITKRLFQQQGLKKKPMGDESEVITTPNNNDALYSIDALLCGHNAYDSANAGSDTNQPLFERDLMGLSDSQRLHLFNAATLNTRSSTQSTITTTTTNDPTTSSIPNDNNTTATTSFPSVVEEAVRHQVLFSGGSPSGSLTLGLQTKEPYKGIDPRVVHSQLNHEWDRQDMISSPIPQKHHHHTTTTRTNNNNAILRKTTKRPLLDESLVVIARAQDAVYARTMHSLSFNDDGKVNLSFNKRHNELNSIVKDSPYFHFEKGVFNPLSTLRNAGASVVYDRLYKDRNPLGLQTADNRLSHMIGRAVEVAEVHKHGATSTTTTTTPPSSSSSAADVVEVSVAHIPLLPATTTTTNAISNAVLSHRLEAWAFDDQLEHTHILEPYTLTMERPYISLDTMSRTGCSLSLTSSSSSSSSTHYAAIDTTTATSEDQSHQQDQRQLVVLSPPSIYCSIDEGPLGLWVCGPRSSAWEYFMTVPQEDRVYLAAHIFKNDDDSNDTNHSLHDPLIDWGTDGSGHHDELWRSKSYGLTYLDHYQIITGDCAQIDWLQLSAGLESSEVDVPMGDSRRNHITESTVRMPSQMSGAGKITPSAILQRFLSYLYRPDRTSGDASRKLLLESGGALSQANSALAEMHSNFWFPLFHFLLPVPCALPYLCSLLLSSAPFHPVLPMGTYSTRPLPGGGTPTPGGSPLSPTSGILGEYLGLSLSSSFSTPLEILSLIVSQCMPRRQQQQIDDRGRQNISAIGAVSSEKKNTMMSRGEVMSVVKRRFHEDRSSSTSSLAAHLTSAFIAVSCPNIIALLYNSGALGASSSSMRIEQRGNSSHIGYVHTGVGTTTTVAGTSTTTTTTAPHQHPNMLVFTTMEAARVLLKVLGVELDNLLFQHNQSSDDNTTSTTSTSHMDAILMGRLSGVYVYGLHSQTFVRRALPFITDTEYSYIQTRRDEDDVTLSKADCSTTSNNNNKADVVAAPTSVDWESISRRLLFSFEHGDHIGSLLAEAYCRLSVDAHTKYC